MERRTMTWVILGETINGETLYGRIDDDEFMRVTAVSDNPELVAWLAAGNTPEPWPPNEGAV